MKVKTSELAGVALDYAVAVAEGGTGLWHDTVATWWIAIDGRDRALKEGWAQSFTPSTDWAQGGPIIQRERIGLDQPVSSRPYWTAFHQPALSRTTGVTPLIAAMRCYVLSRLGEEVEVPEELK